MVFGLYRFDLAFPALAGADLLRLKGTGDTVDRLIERIADSVQMPA